MKIMRLYNIIQPHFHLKIGGRLNDGLVFYARFFISLVTIFIYRKSVKKVPYLRELKRV